ncbi:DRTGG domain-containing protein [Alicyclobacillus shizuokensis]|uniref:DRTGG domain-containing protein n=1 Tax=Alicyclobacillus shizuokensis TaxID=392014 RepID=UPI00083695BE|nr:DRTGG domain-containing protein [Alicyclobacillus shizuokensis]MCL6626473.1 CBS domain-containing protein [Alicyclobacillus shizuokensis]
MTTKHERILEYIQNLQVGERISVRGIARDLGVSEGTAYRAIKEAELRGWVSSIDRIGTVRIDRQEKRDIERLTFAEVVGIVEGTVLGGRDGLHKTLQKFVIGAMQLPDIVRYISPGSLMLVGNREQVQRLSLEHGAAVLITGGFEASEEVQRLANERQLPLLSSSYDTFTTAALINRAIYDRLIKKDILYVEDIVVRHPLATLHPEQTVRDYLSLVESTGHARVPVIDERGHLVGILTARDVAEARPDARIEQYMRRNPFFVTPQSTVASAAHRMVWEGIELLPVVDQRRLVGVVSRQDVIKALQLMSRQPQVAETLTDLTLRGFREDRDQDGGVLVGDVTPQMTNAVGTLATGPLMTLIERGAMLCLERSRHGDMRVENVTLYFLRPISVDGRVAVKARILDSGRRFAKVDVEVYEQGQCMAKALLTAQTLDRIGNRG